MIRLLFVFALCVAYLFPPACVQAQQSEYVTARNISSFALYQRSDRALDLAATVACRAQGTDRRLGRLTLAGQPSTITVGALFVPLSPTISEQEARLRKKINSGLRAVKRSGSARAKKQAQRGLKKVRGELSKLLLHICPSNS
jgi:hypothetical protein